MKPTALNSSSDSEIRGAGTRDLHEVPHWSVIARRQFSLLLESRRVWILLALCTVPTLLYELTLNSTSDGHAVFLSPTHPLVNVTAGLVLVAAIWPLLVWRGEPWGNRDYHSALPVERMTHDLLRVLSGAVWLMIGVSVSALLALFVTMHVHGGAPIPTSNGGHVHYHPSAAFWGNFYLAPLIMYTFVSILPLAVRRPLEWIVAILAGFLFVVVAMPNLNRDIGERLFDFMYHPFGIFSALWGETSTRWFYFLRDSGATFSMAVAYAQNTGTDPYPPAPPVGHWVIATSIWLSIDRKSVV